MGRHDSSWTHAWASALVVCSEFGDGNYTLPVPDSEEYHDYISGFVTDAETVVPLGFSDETGDEFINVYTSKPRPYFIDSILYSASCINIIII